MIWYRWDAEFAASRLPNSARLALATSGAGCPGRSLQTLRVVLGCRRRGGLALPRSAAAGLAH